jgi:transglutaminase/protease-like cytokinesis protein 3
MASTYEKIATTTLGSAQATVTFSSISGSYTDLVLIGNLGGSSTNQNCRIQFNSDTGTNYSLTEIIGNGSVASSRRITNNSYAYFSYDAAPSSSIEFNGIFQINNYSNTTTYKTYLSRANAAHSSSSPGTSATVGLWRSTNAITRLDITMSSGNLISGSTFTLYGIAKA